MLKKPWIDPAKETLRFPPPTSAPIPYLPIHQGYRCPSTTCAYVAASKKTIGQHLIRQHPEIPRNPRGHPRALTHRPHIYPQVSCQRFFVSGHSSQYFAVIPPISNDQQRPPAPSSATPWIEAQITTALARGEAMIDIASNTIQSRGAPTEASPWLDMTRWGDYLRGYSFTQVVPLGAHPDPLQEPLLVEFASSISRIIQQAYQSIQEDRINVFDQVRINSFLQRQRAWDRPLFTRLKKGTSRKYEHLWKRLICFVYRSTQVDQPVRLRHQLTLSQFRYLDEMVDYGTEVLAYQGRITRPADSSIRGSTLAEARALLDRACLHLSIALLDHTLKGDLFESALVGFLAVLGVDAEKRTWRDAYTYTPLLSGIVKMAQMLVVQEAVMQADEDQVEHPADALDEMRERFMVHGTRSPFAWITRLRTYGKKVQNTTTSLGYIYWSEDQERLSYKGLEMTMESFRRFVQTEVREAQQSLETLFLLHEEESRESVIPSIPLSRLQDDPSESRLGWNFLQDARNAEALPNGRRWLLDRVLKTEWLRMEFLDLQQPSDQIKWKIPAVQAYLRDRDRFLELLLLLCHLTGGQPARGTEILSLRHRNTLHGRHRSIFIEQGLVSTVTSYHKGYHITGSTKIIHRYLPKEVSELVIYYLWIILPFCESLEILAFEKTDPLSPFLWPLARQGEDSSYLSKILEKEARQHLKTKCTITYYRHAAIAISRAHLPSGGFKRDYGVNETATDQQGSHTSWTAGTIYARGIQEAPGHVEERRTNYRTISREWHSFLGFKVHLGPRKRPLLEKVNDESLRRKKRTCVPSTEGREVDL
ncbi:hypothetical protein PENOC_112060 [Penicillium occitanis (nom. inval.)]|nr:hypothetical protein PENOC_112060 [Penicillium occitanis (nom. inval.)]